MPKRVLDGEGLWGSSKLSECPEWAIPLYAWLYPLADANGSFEITNLRVVWCKVSAILPNFSLETLTDIVRIFREHGLLFAWEQDGKKYAHWTGSEKKGRLPQPGRRTSRYGPILAPPVPAQQLQDYQTRQQNRRIATTEASQVLVLELVSGLDGRKEGAPENGAPVGQSAPRPSLPVFTGTHLKVAGRQHSILALAFPWIDLMQEYAKADSWLEANPTRRPKNSSRFLHHWVSQIRPPSNDAKGGSNHAAERTRNNLRAAGFGG